MNWENRERKLKKRQQSMKMHGASNRLAQGIILRRAERLTAAAKSDKMAESVETPASRQSLGGT